MISEIGTCSEPKSNSLSRASGFEGKYPRTKNIRKMIFRSVNRPWLNYKEITFLMFPNFISILRSFFLWRQKPYLMFLLKFPKPFNIITVNAFTLQSVSIIILKNDLNQVVHRRRHSLGEGIDDFLTTILNAFVQKAGQWGPVIHGWPLNTFALDSACNQVKSAVHSIFSLGQSGDRRIEVVLENDFAGTVVSSVEL